jgi:CreA protein
MPDPITEPNAESIANPIVYDGTLTCALAVKDRKASAAWYAKILGFTLLYDAEDIGWCEMQSPVEKVCVGFSEVETPQVEGGPTLVFGVDDVAAVRTRLEGQGVKFDGETVTYPGLVILATFFDPDGHKYMLSQSLGKTC